jgi:hypothetical protein
MEHLSDTTIQMRLIESWLPLAQAENTRNGWGQDALALEALIIAAAPALRHATSTLSARAILWHYHRQLQKERG